MMLKSDDFQNNYQGRFSPLGTDKCYVQMITLLYSIKFTQFFIIWVNIGKYWDSQEKGPANQYKWLHISHSVHLLQETIGNSSYFDGGQSFLLRSQEIENGRRRFAGEITDAKCAIFMHGTTLIVYTV
jgi:hypothetical protein